MDPYFIDVSLHSDSSLTATGSVTELSYNVVLKPCWFAIRISPSIKETEISLIKTTAGSPNSWPLWRVNTLVGLDGRSSIKEQKEDGYIFRISNLPEITNEEIVINPGESDQVRLTLRTEKPEPVLMLQPTEINLPPTSMMRTIPLIPRPRLVLFFHTGDHSASSLFARDLVTLMECRSVPTREIVREIHAHDTVVVTESVEPFVVGLAVGAGKLVHIIGSDLSEFMENLIHQELGVLVSQL